MSDSSIGVRVIKDHILVDIYDTGERVIKLGGKDFIIMGDDKLKSHHNVIDGDSHPGIRPRWAIVLSASDYAEETGIRVGDKVLIDNMKWTRAIRYSGENQCWRVHVDDVLLVDPDGLDESEKTVIAERNRIRNR